MIELAINATTSAVATTLAPIIPGISNGHVLFLSNVVVGLLVIASIVIQLRNLRIGRLLIRDKTIMFAGFINKEDYEAVIKAKGHLFRMIPEEELMDKELRDLNGHHSGTTIVPGEKGHLKKEEDKDSDSK